MWRFRTGCALPYCAAAPWDRLVSGEGDRPMRQTVLTGLAVVFLLGCEDGPTQTYKTAPEGAGDNWNDGKTGGSSDPSKQGFTGSLGGTTAVELCDAPTKKAKWGAAFAKHIKPP